MAASAIPAQSAPAPRIQSVDALRGAIMMLMAIDHLRDYVARSAQQFLPTDLTRTTPAIFFTRWITHFCAPVFMLTAGLGAYLWMTRGRHSKGELSRLLVSRGIWLIALEVTVLRLIMLSQISFTANPVLLIILWAIGLSMIALAGLIHLPTRVLAVVSIAIIVLHNLLDPVSAERFGRAAWIWDILHQQNVFPFHGINFVTAYPVLPWIGVMAGGYCLGTVFDWDADRRRRFLVGLGLALAPAFFVVRAVNVYGDPLRWSHQASPVFTVLSFLNVTKYPPSLDFLLMTLGPAMVAMAWLEKFHFRFTNPLIVFGRVPFFYYAAHLLLAHLMEIGMNFVRYGAKSFLLIAPPSMGGPSKLFPSDFGFPLWTVYAVWIVVLLLLYPVCLWFARLKQRRHDWWLTYL
ncbi:MAG TPA: heparan-alpha-glucosaminide N-acetyltransferase domain-containing protein [Candidatus Dormibacteraeota bacterium]|nr:heparan-alpha-glucosaminide N-acetyltransferase domain-containing protein [Candidatus Dormibacteraeota bacterium]